MTHKRRLSSLSDRLWLLGCLWWSSGTSCWRGIYLYHYYRRHSHQYYERRHPEHYCIWDANYPHLCPANRLQRSGCIRRVRYSYQISSSSPAFKMSDTCPWLVWLLIWKQLLLLVQVCFLAVVFLNSWNQACIFENKMGFVGKNVLLPLWLSEKPGGKEVYPCQLTNSVRMDSQFKSCNTILAYW